MFSERQLCKPDPATQARPDPALLGAERIDQLAGWWLAQPDSVLRLWALATIGFGVVIVWATGTILV